MQDPQVAETLFLENLERIERLTAIRCLRYGVTGDDADDVSGWVKMKLMENDYAAIRNFRGESGITTYLSVVISRLIHDYWVHEVGRWRPSTAARRMGEVAVRLETLVRRDRLTLAEAGEALRTIGLTNLSDRELAKLLAGLPERAPLRPVVAPDRWRPSATAVRLGPLAVRLEALLYRDHYELTEAIEVLRATDPTAPEEREIMRLAASLPASELIGLLSLPIPPSSDVDVLAGESEVVRARLSAALWEAIRSLDPEDALIIRMHLSEGHSVAEISKALGLEQKPLYRRLHRILNLLRQNLEAAGVTQEQVAELIADETEHDWGA
jgi:RNA polymerase sigma factor for flagellar operon FliA